MITHFSNVTISIDSTDPKTAYTMLCDIFAIYANMGILEYTTDTFSRDNEREDFDTEELFETEEKEL